MGPLLFNLFINDLPSVASNCGVLMYADDTVLYYANKESDVNQRVLNENLEKLNTWLIENNLFLNIEKTEAVLFGTTANLSKVTNYQLVINGSPLKRVSEFRYLDIVLNENLSWNAHIDDIIVKVGKRLGLLRRLRRNLTMHAAETVYK